MSDPLPIGLSLVLILLLVGMNSFFVAAEYAMIKLRGSRLEMLAYKENKRSRLSSHLTGNLDAYLLACQLGITLASIGLGWIGEPAIARTIGPLLGILGFRNELFNHIISFFLAFIFLAGLRIVLGKLAPKAVAIRKSELIALLTAAPVVYFYRMMFPFIWVLNRTSNQLLKFIGIEPAKEKDAAHNEEEIRVLMKESHKKGLIDYTELTLVDNIFEFTETNAREIMIRRTEMICLNTALTLADNKNIVLEQMLTRYPVCENDKDNIIGFIHIKDLLKDTSRSLLDIIQIMRPVTTVPESIQISKLLKLMQKRKSQIAILIDEYGGTSGLVTLEDIMEEIIGEIQDEFDEEREELKKKVEQMYSNSGQIENQFEKNDGRKIGS